MNGLIHLYHGDGKGKTSAATGLAIRAAGHGLKVIFLQFLKGAASGEILILNQLDHITVLRNSKDFGFISNMSKAEIIEITNMHNSNLKTALNIIYGNTDSSCDVLILDEVCAAYRLKVVDRHLIDKLITDKPAHLELVLTGRQPDNIFTDNADYITEMYKERHPYDKNISARPGIEY